MNIRLPVLAWHPEDVAGAAGVDPAAGDEQEVGERFM
jgi:hypothetical protein